MAHVSCVCTYETVVAASRVRTSPRVLLQTSYSSGDHAQNSDFSCGCTCETLAISSTARTLLTMLSQTSCLVEDNVWRSHLCCECICETTAASPQQKEYCQGRCHQQSHVTVHRHLCCSCRSTCSCITKTNKVLPGPLSQTW